jgi:homoaconitase/3-isopropylmalate dehydratase large subunit
MGHTIAEKILGNHAGGKPARAGEIVVADVDFSMIHDARAGNALKMIEKLGAGKPGFTLPHVKRTLLAAAEHGSRQHSCRDARVCGKIRLAAV